MTLNGRVEKLENHVAGRIRPERQREWERVVAAWLDAAWPPGDSSGEGLTDAEFEAEAERLMPNFLSDLRKSYGADAIDDLILP